MPYREHHCGGPVLQICPLQHLQDPALPHEGSSSAPGLSAGHLPSRPLQLAPGWTSCLGDQTFAAYPESCNTLHVQPNTILPCDTPFPWPPLAPCSSLHQIQDDGTGLQGGQWNCPCLSPSSRALLNYFSWTPGTAIAKGLFMVLCSCNARGLRTVYGPAFTQCKGLTCASQKL